jgi:hypothetical protein
VASAGLVVDVPQFTACVLQEKLALNPLDRDEEVYKEDSEPCQKHGPVQMKNEPPVRHQELELAHETKRTGEQHSKGDMHGIRDHLLISSFTQQFEPLFRLFEAQFSLISSEALPGPGVE